MSGWFIVTLVVAVVAAVVVLGAVIVSEDTSPAAVLVGGGAAWVLVVGILLFISSATVVATRSVGVETSFGKPIGALKNGFHMVRPWASVEKFDTSIQTLNLTTAKEDAGDPVTVRLGNQTTAQVDVSVQWNIDPNGDVIELYRRYKSFENVEGNLVKRQLQHALNNAFAAYDPLRSINNNKDAPSQSVDDLADKARTELQKAVGTGIQIGTLTIPIVHFDGDTEQRLKQFQQALADTRIAEQKKATAEKDAETNRILAESVKAAGGGPTEQCLALVREIYRMGKDIPPGFSCFPGSGTPVIAGK